MAPIGIDDDQLEVMRREAQAAAFSSEEARQDFERARRRRVVLFVLGGCLLVGWSVFMVWLGRGTGGTKEEGDGHGHGGEKVSIEPVGSPNAKVKVLCVLPDGSGCHTAVVKLFTAAAQKHPREIRIDFSSMEEVGEEELTSRVGEYCAAVAINDKTSFEVQKDGKKRRINLIGTVPSHYSLSDVMDALTHEYVAVYGDPGEPLLGDEEVAACSDQPPEPESPNRAEEDEDEEEIELPLSGQLKLSPK